MADAGTALTKTTSADWRIACSREPVIRALDEMPRITRIALRDAGAELGLSRSRLYELLARYREAPVTSALLDQADGYPKGRQLVLKDRRTALLVSRYVCVADHGHVSHCIE